METLKVVFSFAWVGVLALAVIWLMQDVMARGNRIEALKAKNKATRERLEAARIGVSRAPE